MTDNEVIKALEICTSGNLFGCDKCAFVEYKMGHDGCYAEMLPSAIDLINRQKAEIERLSNFVTEERCREIANEMIPQFVRQARIEAIKEFADRLYKKLSVTKNYAIDEVLREMVGDDNA